MKKTLALVLSLILVVCMAVPAFAAPAGTAVTNEAEFLAMTADGTYYLANDITITSSCFVKFTGTFDGNGKTITTTVPVFDEVDGGTIKNLTVAGEIVVETVSNRGALVNRTSQAAAGDVLIENVTNNANITAVGALNVAGFVGRAYGTSESSSSVTFKNCVNNGNVNGNHAAGFVSYKDKTTAGKGFTLTCIDCVNNGTITTTGAKTTAAGFFGNITESCDNNIGAETILAGCVNNGKITCGADAEAKEYGGIGGFIGCIGGLVNINNCKNAGVVDTTPSTNSKAPYVAGFIASVRSKYTYIEINNCDSVGTVMGSAATIGTIIGYSHVESTHASSSSINNCYVTDTEMPIYGGTKAKFDIGATATAPQYKAPEPVVTGDTTAMFVAVAAVVAGAALTIAVRKKEN